MPLSLPLDRTGAGVFRWCRVAIGILGIALGAAAGLLVIAGLVLHWVILPHLDNWRPRIEAMVSRSLGAPVRIGRISVDTDAWVPSFDLGEVVLYDADQREALRLPRVRAALSAAALATLEPRFAQLLVDAPRLEIRRDRQGRIRVGGLDVQTGTAADSEVAADWLFSQPEIVIRGGRLRWIDELRSAPALELSDVTLVLRNGLRSHDLRLDATPPPEWGQRFSARARLRQPLIGRAGDWRRWSGTLQADLPLADVSQLRRHVDLPFEADRGVGALRAWLDLDSGNLSELTIDLAVREVAVRLGAQLEPIALDRVEGRLSARRDGDKLRLAARALRLTTADGGVWPEGDIALMLVPGRAQGKADAFTARSPAQGVLWPASGWGDIAGGELSADRLDLDLLARLASRMPLGIRLRQLLLSLAPRGSAQNLQANWQGPLDAPTHFRVVARLRGLTIAAAAAPDPLIAGRPGWRNVDLDLDASEDAGRAHLAINGGSVNFPGIFEQPEIALRQVSAELAWKLVPPRSAGAVPGIELNLSDVRFDNDDAAGELNAQWRTGPGDGFGKGGRFPGVLQLDARLSRGLAASVARYLPLGIPEPTRDYVQRAVRGGELSQSRFQVRGDLWDFPFGDRRDGDFRIATHLHNVSLNYVPGRIGYGREAGVESPWPAFTALDGELVFDRQAMQILGARANLLGLGLHGVNGTIRDLFHDPTLEIDGRISGPFADMVRYVNVSPVSAMIGAPLTQAFVAGPAELRLALSLPLHHINQTTVRGSVVLAGNEFRLRPDLPPLLDTRARVDFTHKGVTISAGSAKAFGGELSFDGASQADGSLRLNAQGVASADGLRRTAELGPLARLARNLGGQSPYRLQILARPSGTDWSLSSPMTGMAISLPSPLDKPAEAGWPLRWQFSHGGAAGPDRASLDLGAALRVRLAHGNAGWSGAVTVSDGARSAIGSPVVDAAAPAAGWTATLDLRTLDTDAWRRVADRLMADAGLPFDATVLPSRLNLRSDAVLVESRRLDAVSLSAQRLAAGWHLEFAADQIAGSADYQDSVRGGNGKLKARLGRLSLARTEAEHVESLLDQAPASMPALDIVVDDFELRGHKLGRVEIDAVNRPSALAGVPADWLLSRLDVRNPDAHLAASGQWVAAPGTARRRMGLKFQLELGDGAALLERLGYGRVLQGGKGQVGGEIGWLGSPWLPEVASLDGQVDLAITAGQFLQVDAGAAKLFSLLSLQSLPRRLTLDFRDVFLEGFAFDHLDGELHFAQGIAKTNNLRVRSVQAAVLAEGSADLSRQTQDLSVIVVPEINAGTASLAYAAIHPAIGLGTFFAQWLLRRPLQEAGTRQYHVSGSWDEPRITRIERRPGAPMPDLEALPAERPAAPAPQVEPAALEPPAAPAPVQAPDPQSSGMPASHPSTADRAALRDEDSSPNRRTP